LKRNEIDVVRQKRDYAIRQIQLTAGQPTAWELQRTKQQSPWTATESCQPGDTSEVAPQDNQPTASHENESGEGHTNQWNGSQPNQPAPARTDPSRRPVSPAGRTAKPPQPWRPPSRKTQAAHNRQLFVAVGVALVVSTGALWVFARIASKHAEAINLGSRVFSLGNAESRIKQAKVAPLFFNDLVRDERGLPVVLAYIRDKEWAALNAIPPGSTEDCIVKWDEENRALIDPCTKKLYGPNGVGDKAVKPLTRYSTVVDTKGRLIVNLNKPFDPATLTTTSAPPTTVG
jgi:hypothetical protein